MKYGEIYNQTNWGKPEPNGWGGVYYPYTEGD